MDSERLRMSGLLACDKPAGITSRDCVNHVERLLRSRYPKPAKIPKVGHAGTLDPLATGVLVIGVGAGVRLVPYIQQMNKYYQATFRLGWWSDSGDLDGKVRREESASVPALEQLEAAAGKLTGEITQIPPATSAIKVGGKKAYKYAHQGIAVDVPPRMVRVDRISIDRYDYPEVDLSIVCGSGTYVRTLGMDLAIACGTRGVMTQLRRTRIGEFSIDNCVELDRLTCESLEQHLLPLSLGVSQLPRLELSESQTARLCLGSKIPASELSIPVGPAIEEAAVIDAAGMLRAICRKAGDLWCPYRVFHH
ncbi:MAG: tRNA pseudouridine(55) synthase TruB [Planctomycetaceae bacterium]